jgi:hypothetical protein
VTSEPIDGSEDGKVVPLRATDAGTETRVTESARPAYTDLSDGRAQRKPVIPAHWRTWEAAREHVELAAAPGMGTPPPITASAHPATSS